MDVRCRGCGEPWSTAHIAESPLSDFLRSYWIKVQLSPRSPRRTPVNRGSIEACPCCPVERRALVARACQDAFERCLASRDRAHFLDLGAANTEFIPQ